MPSISSDRARRGILVLFGILFGAGLLVFSVADGRPAAGSDAEWARAAMAMVDEQIAARGIKDARLLAALRKVPRHEFVPAKYQDDAYADRALPIAHGQTISQPYIVAAMTEHLNIAAGDRVLEVGTGSGYQAAVLAELGAKVYSIEIIKPLATEARARLDKLGYDTVQTKVGDGFAGWPAHAPFDAIIVTAAPPAVPPPLLEQLKPGGKLVIPVGDATQVLRVIHRKPSGELTSEDAFEVRFVPMTGRAMASE